MGQTSLQNSENLDKSEIYGTCVGRRLMGKKMMFLDLIQCEKPENDEEESKAVETSKKVHHGLGDHVQREKMMKLENVVQNGTD